MERITVKETEYAGKPGFEVLYFENGGVSCLSKCRNREFAERVATRFRQDRERGYQLVPNTSAYL